MPSSDPIQRFQDILENIARIEEFTAGMDLQHFRRSTEAVYAVKYALLVISEAAAKLGELAVELCPGISWTDIRGLGNRLRHEYHTIDVVRLWRVVERDLAPLKTAVQAVLEKLREKEE